MRLSQIPMFNGLSQKELDHLAGCTLQRTYPKGTTLFVEGQPADGLYFITTGLVKVVKLHNDGREKTLALLGEGKILGEMSLFSSGLRTATAEALDKTTVLVLLREPFRALLLEMPILTIRLIEILSARLNQANQQIQALQFMNARSRIIASLIQLAKDYGQTENKGITIPLQLTHAEIAKLAGVSRETVTKVFADLQKNNLLKPSRKQLWISGLDTLYREI
ncbi:MAG: Crp/Fnr family transcriptional regulator [Heliobacteriaceae bacterium]|nr:Crp/Fnr family transcriptional regulator [Heliobacteriaceae bacterium]MDD4587543.1 Crp/Fnr family transcriptional regulator [Heliobacteriaceae bacterium]